MRRAAIVLPLLFLALILVPSPASARQFLPCQTVQVADTTPGAPSDITYSFGIGVGPDCAPSTPSDSPDYQKNGFAVFSPPGWGIARDSDIPDGTQVGTFSSTNALGLLNNPCNTIFNINADLLDGTISESNPIQPRSPGQPDRLHPLAQDANHNGIPDAADRWPSYLTDLAAREDWDLGGLISRAVGIDTTDLIGSTIVVNLLTFAPHTRLGPRITPDTRLGYPMLAVLNDPTLAPTSEDPVSDSCTPFTFGWTFFGEASGHHVRTNPADGVYDFTTYTEASPDADDDGIENALDPCPLTADSTWDPRGPALHLPGDPDGDGLPDSCDPHPNAPSMCTAESGLAILDEDCDGWMNRADNCPLVANPDQLDSDGDDIGDACDPTPNDVSGNLHTWCNVTSVTIGAGGTDPLWPGWLHPCAFGGYISGDANCDGSLTTADVIAALSELAGVYDRTLCTEQVTCDEPLAAPSVLYLLRGIAQAGFILRPCDFNTGPVE